MRYQRAEHPLKLDGLAAARAFFAGCIADSDPSRESLWVAHVDDEAHCLHVSRHDGDETGAEFPIRQIIRDAAVHGSTGLVLAHNHPSGDPTPSADDRIVTEQLVQAGRVLDIPVQDHIIIGRGRYLSFAEAGLL